MLRNQINKIRLLFRKDRESYLCFYRILGFMPRNISLYRQALLHKSTSLKSEQGRPLNNERLEFLGDAVLDAVVADLLYKHFESRKEGFLTNTRSKIVQRETLNKLAVEIGLDKLVKYTTRSSVHNSYMYGNAFEAFMGAIYLDQGYDRCKEFMEKKIFKEYIDLDTMSRKEVNFKSKLIEWSQKHKIEVSFEFSVLTLDELSIPELAPYEPSENQSELERAFESLKGMNYTVSLLDDDKTANNADVKADMKVTDGLIVVKQDGENPYGYIKTGEGEMESFEVDDDGVVRGTALPFEGTVASLIEADYSTSASLFRPVEGKPGTYMLAPEATSYAKYNDPAYPIDTSIEMANPGTFLFSITEGGFEITYDYYYAFGAAVYDGTVTIAITEVGTTQAEYTLEDLVEFVPPASWEELGATASISPWLAGHPEVLPYPTYEMGAKAVETLDTEEYYGIYATPIEEGKEDDLMDAYVAALTSAGWREEDSGYVYYIDGNALTCTVSVYDGSLLIYLYTPTPTDALTTLIRGKLALNPNSTVSFAITDTTYKGYGTASQEVTSQKTTDYFYEWDVNSAHAKMTVDGKLTRDDYYIPEGTKVNQYSYLTGSLEYVEWWNSLLTSNLFTWYNFYTSELIGITDLGDGAFTVSGDALDRILIIMTQYEEVYEGKDFGSMKVFYDEEAGKLTGTANKVTTSGSSTRVLTLSMTVSDIGTTEIDFPSK